MLHPSCHILDSYMDGSMIESLTQPAKKLATPLQNLQPEEAAVLVLLQRRLADEKKQARTKGRRLQKMA